VASRSEIKKNSSYSIDDAHALLNNLTTQAPTLFLFTPNIRHVKFYNHTAEEPEKLILHFYKPEVEIPKASGAWTQEIIDQLNNQTFAYRIYRLQDKSHTYQPEGLDKALVAFAEVAVRLREDQTLDLDLDQPSGQYFYGVPTPITTPLPILINAPWFLNSSRTALDTTSHVRLALAFEGIDR